MKKKSVKKSGIPPLLCWDIYSEWLNEKLGITPAHTEKTVKKKKQEL
jgi:hypothetical protein